MKEMGDIQRDVTCFYAKERKNTTNYTKAYKKIMKYKCTKSTHSCSKKS